MDQTTVISLLALNMIAIGGLLLLIGRRMTDAAGLHGFGIGSLAFGAAYLMRLALGFTSGGMQGVAADVCMVYATLCFATGLAQFSGGAPLGRRRVFVVTTGYAAAALLATWLWDGVGRHAALNLALGAGYGLLGWLALRAARREAPALRLPMGLLSGMLAVISFATLVRAVVVVAAGLPPLFAGPVAQAYYAYSVVFTTILGPNLLWMVFLRLNGRLNELATHDALTRLPNRNGLDEALSRHFAVPSPAPMVLLVVDVDHFKRINDGFGHAAGDQVLRGVARVLKEQVRDTDIVTRWGGEEFMVCCRGAQTAQAPALAERLRQAVADLRHTLPDGRVLSCTVSIGVSRPFDDRPAWEPASRAADAALYEAKRRGRDQVRLAEA